MRTDVRTDGQTYGRTDRSTDGQTYERTEVRTDLVKPNRIVILIKNICTL